MRYPRFTVSIESPDDKRISIASLHTDSADAGRAAEELRHVFGDRVRVHDAERYITGALDATDPDPAGGKG